MQDLYYRKARKTLVDEVVRGYIADENSAWVISKIISKIFSKNPK